MSLGCCLGLQALRGYFNNGSKTGTSLKRRYTTDLSRDRTNFQLLFLHSQSNEIERCMSDTFERLEVIGSGAFGTVEKCVRKQTGELRAVKQIRLPGVFFSGKKRQEQLILIEAELQALIEVDSQYIVKLRTWFEEQDSFFIVMDYCDGGTLEELLENQVCKEHCVTARCQHMPRLHKYFRHTLSAIAHIHARGIIHRDLKPANVMLATKDPQSPAKLIDFGLAQLPKERGSTDDLSEKELPQGTLEFLAPELLCKCESHTTESDIWSLGILFTHLVTAVLHGKLYHPFLDQEYRTQSKFYSQSHAVCYLLLSDAYDLKRPWSRDLLNYECPCASGLLDSIFEYAPADRATAADLLNNEWVSGGELSSTHILSKGGAMENVKTWPSLSQFDRTVLSLVASYSNEKDSHVMGLARAFRALDSEKNGRLTRANVQTAFDLVGMKVQQEELESIFTALDRDCSNGILFNEWLAATIGPNTVENSVDSVFHALDLRKCGSIHIKDLLPIIGEGEMNMLQQRTSLEADGLMSYSAFNRMALEIASKRKSIVNDHRDAEEVDDFARQESVSSQLLL